MIEESDISDVLEAMGDRRTATARQRQTRSLRGARGVSDGEVARITVAVYKEHGVDLEVDDNALDRLFSVALEDGMVAIALTAAGLPDHPEIALELGRGWLDRVDDPGTADALGWFVLGPAAIATGRLGELLAQRPESAHARRALISAGLALTTEPVQGPCAAALRERVGDRHVRFVESAIPDGLCAIASGGLRDEAPTVRKAMRRLLRAWAKSDPSSLVAWADEVKGGLPRILGEEVAKARRRAAR